MDSQGNFMNQSAANTRASETLPKFESGRKTHKFILQGHPHPDTNTKITQKRKVRDQYHIDGQR